MDRSALRLLCLAAALGLPELRDPRQRVYSPKTQGITFEERDSITKALDEERKRKKRERQARKKNRR